MRRLLRHRRRHRFGATPTPAAGRHLFHVIGDSLTPGTGNLDSERDALDPAPTNAAQYVNRSDVAGYGTVVGNAAPIWFPSNTVARISMVESLLIAYEAARGVPVGVVPYGFAGSSLTVGWNPSTPGANLTAAKAAYTDAIAEFTAFDGVAPAYAGTIIALSSNDDIQAVGRAALKALWLGLIDDWRAFLGHDGPTYLAGPNGTPNLPGYTYYEKRLLAEEVASERVNCFVAHPPFPTAAGDNLHPTKAENRIWGQSLADMAVKALTGTQPLPTLAISDTFASDPGTKLSITLAHTGLSLASRYGVPVITGGRDAALFEIAGTFDAPKLRWVGDGNGPAADGDYEVEISLRNGAWQVGNPELLTVSRVAPQSVLVKPGVIAGAPITEAWGTGGSGFTLTGFEIKKGRNYIFCYNGTGGFKTGNTLTVNGQPATLVADYSTHGGAGNTWVFEFNAAADDANATLVHFHAGSPNSNVYVGSFVVEGAAAGATVVDWQNNVFNNPGAQPTSYNGNAATCPAGGAIVGIGIFTNTGLTVTAGTQLQNGANNTTSRATVAAWRDTDGAISFYRAASGGVYYSRVTLRISKA